MVAGLGYVLLEVLRAWVSDAGTLLLVWMFRGLQWLVQQPMGLGGLAVFAIVAVLALITWWETRPRPEPDEEEPPPIPESERRLIQDVRVAWNRHGRLAVPQLCNLLGDAIRSLERKAFWSPLLMPIVHTMEQRTAELERALEPESRRSIEEVRDRFNGMYDAYIQVMRWTAQLQAENLYDIGERRMDRLDVWRQNHRDFYDRLQDLAENPDHRGTMKIFINWIENPAFRDFLRDAQTSPAWLKLMKEHETRAGEAVSSVPANTE